MRKNGRNKGCNGPAVSAPRPAETLIAAEAHSLQDHKEKKKKKETQIILNAAIPRIRMINILSLAQISLRISVLVQSA